MDNKMSLGDALARVAVLEAEVAELRKRVCVPDVSTMARVLSDRVADARNIDPTDNWAVYGGEYIEDVRAMLAAAPAAQGEPVGFCEDAALSLAERTFGSEVDEQLAEDVIQYARRLYDLYAAPQPAPDVPGLVGRMGRLIAAGNQLNAEAEECIYDGNTAEVADSDYWCEFRDALEAATEALATYRQKGGEV